jgi:monoamine oxidase
LTSDLDKAATDLDVIVVGAGFTGLSAARELDALGLRVLVLDSFTDHLGGRAYSFDGTQPAGPHQPPALRFDHGAEYVGDLQNEIMSIIKEKLPADSLVNGANLRLPYPYEVMVLNQKRYCFKSSDCAFGIPGVPPDLGFVELLGMIGLLAEMTLIEWSIDIMQPWNATGALRELDQVDTWTWLNDKWWVSATVRDLLRISIEALLSVEPSQVSPYYILWYTACNDGFLNEINDDAGGPQQYWLRRGTDTIADAIAEPVKGRIRQGCRVASIDQTGERVAVKLESSPGAGAPQAEVLHAKKVLVATSPATASRIAFTPELPPARRTFMEQPMGKTIKCQIFYKTAWWHDSNGKAYDAYVGGANYPVLWVMDNSPPPSEGLDTHTLMTFTVGAQADTLGPEPTLEAVTKFVTDALATLFEDERAKPGNGEFIRLDMHCWIPSDEHVGGGPNTVFSPKMLTSDVGKMLDQHEGNVFFACAETSKALRPRSTSSRYSLFAAENLPQYDEQSVLLPTSKAPFYSKYSDRRSDLGYMSGGIESGRYVAHEIAQALEKPNELPAPAVAAAAPADPPPLSEHLAADVAAIIAKLRAKIEATAAGDFAAFGHAQQAQGRGAMTSWLRDAITEVARGHAHSGAASGLQGGDPSSALAYLRDFAATTAKFVQADPSTHDADTQPHAQSILDHVRAIEAHLASKFES